MKKKTVILSVLLVGLSALSVQSIGAGEVAANEQQRLAQVTQHNTGVTTKQPNTMDGRVREIVAEETTLSRREILERVGCGVGGVVLAVLLLL